MTSSPRNKGVGLRSLRASCRPDVHGRSPTNPVRLGEWRETWRATKGSDCPWPAWVEAVLPYLSDDEREELLRVALSTYNPNLSYLTTIVSRMCFASAVPVCEGVENHPLWKEVFS